MGLEIAGATLLGYGLTAAGAAVAGIYGAHKQGEAADTAAGVQTKANDAAAANAAATLEFTKQQAAQARADSITAQQASYGQYVARQKNLAPYQAAGQGATATMRHLLGLPDVTIDAPPPFPTFQTTGGAPAPGGGSGPAAGVSADKGDIASQISSYFKSRGVSDHETPYWTQKWTEFGAKDPGYFNQRLSQADAFSGGGAGAPAAMTRPLTTLGSLLDPTVRAPLLRNPRLVPTAPLSY